MPRIRTIKPDFWTDEKLVECSLAARLFFIGTWNFADDNGNLPRSAKKLKMQIFPAELIDCEPLIQELLTQGVLREYSVSGKDYLHIKGFRAHQVINRPSKSALPLPPWCTPEKDEPSRRTHGALTEGSGTEEEKEGEGDKKEDISSLRSEITPEPPSDSAADEGEPEEDRGPIIAEIPLVNGSTHPVYLAEREHWQTLFPGIDVQAELGKCQAWNETNPSNRKTAKGIGRHIVGWLSRAQDRAPRRVNHAQSLGRPTLIDEVAALNPGTRSAFRHAADDPGDGGANDCLEGQAYRLRG